MDVVVCSDKFKGTASATTITTALAQPFTHRGDRVKTLPMADGGEGTLEAFGGANRTTVVEGPLGDAIPACWRLDTNLAIIEMAQASGLGALYGAKNRPVAASTRGTGQLVLAAAELGATRIIVGLGGSATTDGGLGAVEAIGSKSKLAGIELVAAADVTTRFCDAANVFGPQKGASSKQVQLLSARLEALAARYRDEFGVDVTRADGGGAAGGLGGGLLALGADLVKGFALIANEVDLASAVAAASVIVTGEGRLDNQSLAGKVVGGVADLAGRCRQKKLIIIAGQVSQDFNFERLQALAAGTEVTVLALQPRFGIAGIERPGDCCSQAVADLLSQGVV